MSSGREKYTSDGRRSAALRKQSNTPTSVFSDGEREFAEIYGSSKVSSARMFILAMGCIIFAVVAAAALMTVMPLKDIRPWLVEVSPNGVVGKPIEVQKITPNTAVIKAELARWADAVYTIDPLRTTDLYKYANARSKDKAIGQFTEFRVRERTFERMQKEPSLVREVKVTSVDASQPGVAFVFLTTVERTTKEVASSEQVKSVRLTLHYELDAPKSEAELLDNPLGLYVSFFNEAEEK